MSALKTPATLVLAFLFIAGIAVLPGYSNAQSQDDNRVSMRVVPEAPEPFQKVTMTLISFSVDLDRASISWSLNGKKALSGVGEKEFSFLAGGVGEAKRVDITIRTPVSETITKNYTIIPGEIPLLWEAIESYTPPFYKGKALPSSEASIRVVAIPKMKNGGVEVKPENLIYEWKRNNKSVSGSSGYGRNTFVFKAGYPLTNEKIEVFAETVDGRSVAKNQIIITIGEPLLYFYENRPLEGVYYERAIPERVILDTGEIAAVAEPYFFSALGRMKKDLLFSWLLNEKEIPGSENDQGSVVLRAPSGVEGIAELVAIVAHKTKVLQEKDARVLIQFGTTQ